MTLPLTLSAPPTTEPKTPFSLTAEAIEASKSIKLKWNDNADDEKGFIIQREADG
ncbi:MAG: hypothetical protein H7144_06680 [Burkholderiales bacterium]|nr:hypothetical protein [Phycisphaerae bacterium]